MQRDHTVTLGPGPLYWAFTNLEKEGLISMVKEEERRKSFTLTGKGKQVLTEQVRRLEIMTRIGQSIRSQL